MDKVRTAFIGVGYRGKQLFRLLQNIPFFQVQAVADPGVKSSEISGIPCYNQGEDADRKSTRLNSSHNVISRMPSSA